MSLDIQIKPQQKVDIPVSHNSSRYVYQPNFILVNKSTNSSLVFGDLIPFYPSYKHLSDVIVTSLESLTSFILNSHIFAVCVLSFLSETLNNIVYQSYVTLTDGYQTVLNLPQSFANFKKKYIHFVEIINHEQTRQLWWLDTRLSLLEIMDSLVQKLSTTLNILRKFYLFTIVLSFLAVLTISAAANPSSSGSTLGKYVGDTSFEPSIQSAKPSNSPDLLAATTPIVQKIDTTKIFEYTVQTGDTIDSIAAKFSLQPASVQINNGLTDSITVDSKINLPWKDSYIYKVESDISAGDLERIYGVNKQDIINANQGISEGELFKKGTFMIIPSANFDAIAQANKAEEVRKANIVSRSKIPNGMNCSPDLTQGSDLGLIFPTCKTGTRVSRCLQPGHIACDFANFSAPPLFAAKTGTVIAAKYGYNDGYGNYVKINHGNGVVTSYMHLTEIYVKEGQTVIQGETIGQMGTTGNSSGIHLHFEVILNGVLQSPGRFLPWMPPCESSCSW